MRGLRDPRLIFGGTVVVLLLALAALGPLVAPYPHGHRAPGRSLEGPSAEHPLGTDEDGKDMLSEIICGARISAVVGLATVAVSLSVGLLAGLVAGFKGGLADEVVMRLTEALLSFPGILLAILIIFVTRSPGTPAVVLALSATGWAGYARLARSLTLAARERDYVLSARATGASSTRMLAVHILPNIAGPIVVQATFGVAAAILAEASLSFLGLGPQDASSWGGLLEQGAVLFIKSPHIAVTAGLAILVTVLGTNLLGEHLRDRLDPRSERT
jgi:peptide/nickel transport system permease protein